MSRQIFIAVATGCVLGLIIAWCGLRHELAYQYPGKPGNSNVCEWALLIAVLVWFTWVAARGDRMGAGTVESCVAWPVATGLVLLAVLLAFPNDWIDQAVQRLSFDYIAAVTPVSLGVLGLVACVGVLLVLHSHQMIKLSMVDSIAKLCLLPSVRWIARIVLIAATIAGLWCIRVDWLYPFSDRVDDLPMIVSEPTYIGFIAILYALLGGAVGSLGALAQGLRLRPWVPVAVLGVTFIGWQSVMAWFGMEPWELGTVPTPDQRYVAWRPTDMEATFIRPETTEPEVSDAEPAKGHLTERTLWQLTARIHRQARDGHTRDALTTLADLVRSGGPGSLQRMLHPRCNPYRGRFGGYGYDAPHIGPQLRMALAQAGFKPSDPVYALLMSEIRLYLSASQYDLLTLALPDTHVITGRVLLNGQPGQQLLVFVGDLTEHERWHTQHVLLGEALLDVVERGPFTRTDADGTFHLSTADDKPTIGVVLPDQSLDAKATSETRPHTTTGVLDVGTLNIVTH